MIKKIIFSTVLLFIVSFITFPTQSFAFLPGNQTIIYAIPASLSVGDGQGDDVTAVTTLTMHDFFNTYYQDIWSLGVPPVITSVLGTNTATFDGVAFSAFSASP